MRCERPRLVRCPPHWAARQRNHSKRKHDQLRCPLAHDEGEDD